MFRLNDQEYSCSVLDLNIIFDWPTHAEIVQVPRAEINDFWYTLIGLGSPDDSDTNNYDIVNPV